MLNGQYLLHTNWNGWRAGKQALKQLRAWEPLNRLVTSTFQTSMRLTGCHSEFVIKHLPRSGHVRQLLPNGGVLRLWSQGDDWVSTQVYWRGWDGYESETIPLFFRLASKAAVTLDIGAHIGFYTVIAAHANPSGSVYAFEPMTPAFQRLQHHVALNQLSNVTCFPCAVGDHDGDADFYFHPSSGITSSAGLSSDFYRPWAESFTKMAVPLTTLDGFVDRQGIRRVDLMKMDVESSEPDVLRGAKAILQRDQPTIICEVLKGCGSERALEEILRPYGYRFYLLTPNGPIEHEKIEGHHIWLNYLFTTDDLKTVKTW